MGNDKEFVPYFQEGRASVEHRNLDAAGSEHPFGPEPQPFEADLRPLIRKLADDLYESWEATVREYLANGETATLKVQRWLEDPESSPFDDMIVDSTYEPKLEVTWRRNEDSLIIKDNGIGMAAIEVHEIFRQIGRSAARDDGTMSGAFGQGALSFAQFVGLDNEMVMLSHSRLNDDNAAYLITLAGVEPIRGRMGDDEYGTMFQMTAKGDFYVRRAVERYAEYQRVPVIYREYDKDGEECFNEDWGDKSLRDNYTDTRLILTYEESGAFEAFCSPEAKGKTLLLSMDIERNADKGNRGYRISWPIDIRLLDESGKVFLSSNGNEGLMPCAHSDYTQMLIDARDPYIAESALSNTDVIGQDIVGGPNEGKMVVDDSVLSSNRPIPPGEYIAKSDLSGDDEPGQATIIIGKNKGKILVSEEEWDEMDAGRAAMYVPEDDLEPFDLETMEGDLCLPEPTSSRDKLQKNEQFWEYLSLKFASHLDTTVESFAEVIAKSDNPIDELKKLGREDFEIKPVQ